MLEFSVIIMTYNSEWDSLKKTIDSVIAQKEIDYEIILADDASSNNCLQEAMNYLDNMENIEYKVCEHKKNVGTVQNLYDSLSYADGKYVKGIGAGDMLFHENVLRDVYGYMEKNESMMCFGKIQGYENAGGKMKELIIYYPPDIQAFYKNNSNRIKTNVVVNHGWIVGASLFFQTERYKYYLKQLLGYVRYCEDFVQAIYLLNNEKVRFFEHSVIYYEAASGISTNGSSGSLERMNKDQDCFWKMMRKRYKDSVLVRRGYEMRRLENINNTLKRRICIILRNPSYVLMQLRTKFQKKLYCVNEKGRCI